LSGSYRITWDDHSGVSAVFAAVATRNLQNAGRVQPV